MSETENSFNAETVLVCRGDPYGRGEGDHAERADMLFCVTVDDNFRQYLGLLRQAYLVGMSEIWRILPSFNTQDYHRIELTIPFGGWYGASLSTSDGGFQLSQYAVPDVVFAEPGTDTVSLTETGIRFVFSGRYDGEYETDELSWDKVSRIAAGDLTPVHALAHPGYATPADLWADTWGTPLDDDEE